MATNQAVCETDNETQAIRMKLLDSAEDIIGSDAKNRLFSAQSQENLSRNSSNIAQLRTMIEYHH